MKAFLFGVGVVIAVLVPVPLALITKSPSYGVLCFVSGTLAVLFSRLDVLEEVSVGPLKAKLRLAISEANATIEQLRSLGGDLSDATLSLLMATEFMDGMGIAKKFELHQRIVNCLRSLGASAEQVKSAQANWFKGVSIMYLRVIRLHIEERQSFSRVNLDVQPNDQQASNSIHALMNFENWYVPTPAEMRRILHENNVNKPVVNQWIDDYETFLRDSIIPRQDEFLRAQRHS